MKKKWNYFLLLLIACTFMQAKSAEAKNVDSIDVYEDDYEKTSIDYRLFPDSGYTRDDFSYVKKGEARVYIWASKKKKITLPETITYKNKVYTIKKVYVYDNGDVKKLYLPKSCTYVSMEKMIGKKRNPIDIYCPKGMKEMPIIHGVSKKMTVHVSSTVQSGISGAHDYKIRINKKNKVYQAKNNLVLSKSGKILYAVCNESVRKKLVIPVGVTRIAKNACEYISIPVKLPKTLKVIEKEAFYHAWDGKNAKITIPKGVTYIGEEAFAFCHLTKKVKLPKKLKTLGKNAFYRNPAYGKEVDPIDYYPDDESGFQYLLYPEAGFGTSFILYNVKKGDAEVDIYGLTKEKVTIPETVTYKNKTYTIKGVRVLDDSSVEKLYLPKSCTIVRVYAPDGWYKLKLTDIYCPKGMKKLPDIRGLDGESHGKRITVHVPSTVKSGISGVHDYKIRINKKNKVYQSKNNLVLSKNGKILYAVCNASARKRLTLPSSVTRVKNKQVRKYVNKMKKRSK